MIWSLQYRDRRTARIVRDEDGKPVSDYMPWVDAQAIADQHNRESDSKETRK